MKTLFTNALLATLVAAPMSYKAAAMDAPWLNVSGQVNFDYTASKSKDYETNLRTQDAEIKFELILHQGVKIVVKTELERMLRSQGVDVTSDKFDLEKFIEEAYIQIQTDAVSGMPKATIIAGKQQVAFGELLSKLPMFKDNQLYNLLNENEVVGVTVKLPMNFFGIIDEVAASFYETGAGDMQWSDTYGGTLKLSKTFNEKLKATVAGMIKEHEGQDNLELRGTMGIVFNSGSGWQVYSEGVIVRDNPLYDGTKMGASVGGAVDVGPGQVVVEYSYLQDKGHEFAGAYNLKIGQNLVLSPEVRYSIDSKTDETDTRFGIRARISFEKTHKADKFQKR